MSDLRIQVPARVYDRLQANKISLTRIRQAVIKTLEELAEQARRREPLGRFSLLTDCSSCRRVYRE